MTIYGRVGFRDLWLAWLWSSRLRKGGGSRHGAGGHRSVGNADTVNIYIPHTARQDSSDESISKAITDLLWPLACLLVDINSWEFLRC